ncbi:MAG: AAA family ATPase [Firmicutes bacterium]|nr:AAA family ATPase [Bacillota bacterium]
MEKISDIIVCTVENRYFDVAVSFRGYNRDIEKIVERLSESKLKVFYDKQLASQTVGDNLLINSEEYYLQKAYFNIVLFDKAYLNSPHTRREFNYAILRDQITQDRDNTKSLLIYYYFDNIPFETNEYSFYPSKCDLDTFITYAIEYIKSKLYNVPVKATENEERNKEILIDMNYINTISHIKSFDGLMSTLERGKSAIIDGFSGSGKTTLTQNFISIYQKVYNRYNHIIYHEFDDSIETYDEIYTNLLKKINQVTYKHSTKENAILTDENDVRLQIISKLKNLKNDENLKILLVLDNVHKLLSISVSGLDFINVLIENQQCLLIHTINKENEILELNFNKVCRVSNNINWEQEYFKYSFNLSKKRKKTIINIVNHNIKYISVLESLVDKSIINLDELEELKSMSDVFDLLFIKNPSLMIVLTIVNTIYGVSSNRVIEVLEKLGRPTSSDDIELLIGLQLITANDGLYISHDSISYLILKFTINCKDDLYLDFIHELKNYFSKNQTYYDSLYKICIQSDDLNFFRSYITKYVEFLGSENRYNSLVRFYEDFIKHNNRFTYLELRALNIILDACFKTLNLVIAQDILEKTHMYSNTLNLYNIKLHIQRYQYNIALNLLSKELTNNFTFEKISIYFILKMHMRCDTELLNNYRFLIDLDFRVKNNIKLNAIEDKYHFLNLRNTAHLHRDRDIAIDNLLLSKQHFSSIQDKDEFLLATCQNNLGIAYLYKYLDTKKTKFLSLARTELMAAKEYMQDNSNEVYQSQYNLYLVDYFSDTNKRNFALLENSFNKINRLLENTNLHYDKIKFEVTHMIVKYLYEKINKVNLISILKEHLNNWNQSNIDKDPWLEYMINYNLEVLKKSKKINRFVFSKKYIKEGYDDNYGLYVLNDSNTSEIFLFAVSPHWRY